MNIGRMFWTVTRWARAVRFWLFLGLAVVAWFASGQAHAQIQPDSCTSTGPRSANCVYREHAYAFTNGLSIPDGCATGAKRVTQSGDSYVFEYEWGNGCGVGGLRWSVDGGASWSQQCPVGTGLEWNEGLKRCFDPDECLQRNGAANGMPAIETARPFSEKCVAGCQLKMEGPGSCTSIVGQAGSKMCSGVFQYSGNTCSADPPGDPNEPPPPPESDETCKDVPSGAGGSSGLQVCKKNDGQECVTTKSGASICWGTHETGQKSIGNEQQSRGPGTDEPNPTPPTPPETFDPAQKTDPVTTQTTTTNPNGSTTTTTVTTVSNGTTNGTQPPGTPVAPGGGGGGQPGQGEDDEGNSASGGGNCETPPVVEGDAALGMIAKQAWETRCALEKIGKGAKVTGDVGDCESPFTVEGDDASAKQLRAMRAQICPGGDAANNGDGDAIDGSGIDGPDSAEGSGVFVTETFGEEGLNTVGLGFSRTCPVMPQITVLGNVIQFDNSVMCQWLELGGQILLILSALVSVRIMAGVGT